MSETDTPLSKAIETAVALVEWAENSSDTPASFRTCFSQRAIVAEVTGWCGLISERKVLSFPCFCRQSTVWFRYSCSVCTGHSVESGKAFWLGVQVWRRCPLSKGIESECLVHLDLRPYLHLLEPWASLAYMWDPSLIRILCFLSLLGIVGLLKHLIGQHILAGVDISGKRLSSICRWGGVSPIGLHQQASGSLIY